MHSEFNLQEKKRSNKQGHDSSLGKLQQIKVKQPKTQCERDLNGFKSVREVAKEQRRITPRRLAINK